MSRWHIDEDSVATAVGYVLRIGVYGSASLLLVGVILGAIRGMGAGLDAEAPRTIGAVWSGLLAGNPISVIAAGLLVLLATPWIRVAISFVLFVHLRDRIYAAICFVLLLLLTVGLFVGAK
jgi:uncharacterized membrane protein